MNSDKFLKVDFSTEIEIEIELFYQVERMLEFHISKEYQYRSYGFLRNSSHGCWEPLNTIVLNKHNLHGYCDVIRKDTGMNYVDK